MDFTIPDETAQGVLDKWFSDLLVGRFNHLTVAPEVVALKAYHDRQCSVEEAAYAITRPITNDPVPDVPHSYTPSTARVEHLFAIFVRALMDWPSCRTADVIALLVAISKLPDQLHRGAGEEGSGKPMSWSNLPYFRMVWGDCVRNTPGAVEHLEFPRYPDDRERIIKYYIGTQGIYAQLTAAGIYKIQEAYNYLIEALERDPSSYGYLTWYNKFIPEMHVPGCSRWIKACGKRLYEGAIRKEMQTKNSDNDPTMMLNYNHMSVRRWAFWIKRFGDFVDSGDELSDTVKAEAEAAIQHMKGIEESWKAEADV